MLTQKILAEMQALLDELKVSPEGPTYVYETYIYDSNNSYHPDKIFSRRKDAVHRIEYDWGAKQITHNEDSWGGRGGWTFYISKRLVE